MSDLADFATSALQAYADANPDDPAVIRWQEAMDDLWETIHREG